MLNRNFGSIKTWKRN